MRSRQSLNLKLARRTTHDLPFSPLFSTPPAKDQAFHRGAVRLCERRSASYGMGASASASCVSLATTLSRDAVAKALSLLSSTQHTHVTRAVKGLR